jgi:hypothetical protein
MFDQLLDGVRKASESSLQMQQEMLKHLTQQWLSVPPNAGGVSADLGRTFQKRWLDMALEMLTKQRETMDSTYKAGIQLLDQSFRVTEAKSSDDYRRMIEEMWRKSFETFKDQSESQFRDFQKWSEKSAQMVQDVSP